MGAIPYLVVLVVAVVHRSHQTITGARVVMAAVFRAVRVLLRCKTQTPKFRIAARLRAQTGLRVGFGVAVLAVAVAVAVVLSQGTVALAGSVLVEVVGHRSMATTPALAVQVEMVLSVLQRGEQKWKKWQSLKMV
jgi:hypothetical protein